MIPTDRAGVISRAGDIAVFSGALTLMSFDSGPETWTAAGALILGTSCMVLKDIIIALGSVAVEKVKALGNKKRKQSTVNKSQQNGSEEKNSR